MLHAFGDAPCVKSYASRIKRGGSPKARFSPYLKFRLVDEEVMKKIRVIATALALVTMAMPAWAQIERLAMSNPNSPIAEAVTVPLPGYTLYFISGTPAGPAHPELPKDDPARWGDTAAQTDSSLDRLGETLAKLGLGFGDVVQAHVFLVGDPAKGGEIDFPAMNREWSKKFGTPDQPNKPARSTLKIGLATPGALVEIEFIAIKKTIKKKK
jgi:enamine deaminase RidA (YjgF/YER057c/UK114 family)